MTWPSFRIVTANEKSTLTSEQRRQDVNTIYDYFDQPDPVILWQEITTVDAVTDIATQAPVGTQLIHTDIRLPICVSDRYAVSDVRWVETKPRTGPAYGGYDVGNAPRWYAVAKLTDLVQTGLRPFYVINTHFTNGCEWEKPWAECSPEAQFLRPYWNTHWDLLKAEIDHIKDDLDCTVFYGGDFNRTDVPPFGSAQKTLAGGGSIEKLYVIDRSVDTVLNNNNKIDTNSDHPARLARVALSNRP